MQALVGIAVRSGGLRARDISYVAVHGTGTPLGDPIEVGALAAALAPDGSQMSGAVALGSVKVRNFGSIHNQYELHHLVSKSCLIISGPPSAYHAELLHSTISGGIAGLLWPHRRRCRHNGPLARHAKRDSAQRGRHHVSAGCEPLCERCCL